MSARPLERVQTMLPHAVRGVVGLSIVSAGVVAVVVAGETSRFLADGDIPWSALMGAAVAFLEVVWVAVLVGDRSARRIAIVLALHATFDLVAFGSLYVLRLPWGQKRWLHD